MFTRPQTRFRWSPEFAERPPGADEPFGEHGHRRINWIYDLHGFIQAAHTVAPVKP
jgi:succinylglutamate desuccinylase